MGNIVTDDGSTLGGGDRGSGQCPGRLPLADSPGQWSAQPSHWSIPVTVLTLPTITLDISTLHRKLQSCQHEWLGVSEKLRLKALQHVFHGESLLFELPGRPEDNMVISARLAPQILPRHAWLLMSTWYSWSFILVYWFGIHIYEKGISIANIQFEVHVHQLKNLE